MKRRPRAGILIAVIAVLGGSCAPRSASTVPTPDQRAPIGPATPQALRTVATAIGGTLGTTVAVSYDLIGAQVFGPASETVSGRGTFDLRRGVGKAQLSQASGTQLLDLTPTVVFTRVPSGSAAALPRGKSWMSATLDGSESLATNFPQFVIQVEGFNPLLYLDEVAWGAVSAAPLGSEVIKGVPARGYLVTVSLPAALGKSKGPSATSMSVAIRSELTSLGVSRGRAADQTVRLRLWIDRSGRVVTIQASPPGTGVGTTTMVLAPSGSTVKVVPPGLSKVVDIASLTPLGEQENNGKGDADGA
jgi:hypothetical protein